MGSIAWHNPPMRWPWSGIQDELRLLREQHEEHRRFYARSNERYDGLLEEHRRFTTECIMDMRRWSDERDRERNARLDEIIAEQRAQREVLFRMLDRFGPAPGTA
jgi:hypothetical protein